VNVFQEISLPYQQFGSFLPEQVELFTEIYNVLNNPMKKVNIFTAPPASGKTHVISLLANFLISRGHKIAIVVPNNYLKNEFERSKLEVIDRLEITILNLFEYLNSDEEFDFILIDEAHNIKSYLDLDINNVKNFEIDSSTDLFSYLIQIYLYSEKDFCVKQLDYPSARNLLELLEVYYPEDIEDIIKDPTQWLTFIYIWKESGQALIKWVKSESIGNFKLPKGILMLFSATTLSDEELEFYCGIPSKIITRVTEIKSQSKWRNNQRVYVSIKDEPLINDKIEYLKSILKCIDRRALILCNNYRTSNKIYFNLCDDFDNIFLISPKALDRYEIYGEYLTRKNGILLTSSSIFWEGITVPNLDLLIIFNVPFPRPQIMDILKGRTFFIKEEIARRLEQSLGRIGRKKGEFGLGLTLFDIHSYGLDLPTIVCESKYIRLNTWDVLLLINEIYSTKTKSIEMLCSE